MFFETRVLLKNSCVLGFELGDLCFSLTDVDLVDQVERCNDGASELQR